MTTLVGLNGQGKTNLVEAIGYLATLVEPPGRDRPAAGAVRGRAGGDPWRRRARRPRDAGRARDQPRPGQPGPAGPVARAGGRATCSAPCAPCCSRPRTSPWSRATPSERRRFLDDLLVPRQPRWAGVRGDYDKVLKQRNALLKSAAPVLRRGGRAGTPRRPSDEPVEDARASALHTLDVWNEPPRPVGSQLLYAPAAPAARPRALPRQGVRRGQRRAVRRPGRPTELRCARRRPRRIAAGEVPDIDELRTELLATLAEVRVTRRSSAACRSSVRTATTSCCPSATCRPRAMPATASPGRSRWDSSSRHTSCSRHDLGDDPVLILDDVFAELDTGRRERLADAGRRLRAGAHHRGGRRRRADAR